MEIQYRRCVPDHFRYIEVQDAQRHDLAALLHTEHAEAACSHIALSAWLGNRCLGAAGIIPLWPHRAMAWAMVSRNIGAAMVPISRKVRQVVRDDPTPRIEMTVAADFKAGHTWARLLGMTLETPEPLRKFGANGADEYMYARVRED